MPVSDAELKIYVDAYHACGKDKAATGRRLGVSRAKVFFRLKAAQKRGLMEKPTVGQSPPPNPAASKVDASPGEVKDVVTSAGRELSSFVPRIKTVEDLIADRGIDLDIWKVDWAVVNQWEMGAKLPDGSIVTTPLVQVKIRISQRQADDAKILGREILDAIANLGPIGVRPRPVARKGLLFEFNPADLHIGKLAWDQEAGESYDSRIAESACLETLEDCISQLMGDFAQAVLVMGNDLLHCDNLESSTTKGTRVDADTRYHKMHRLAQTLMIRVVERMKAVAPVRVIVIPGNHDRVSAFTLGEVLSAYYRNDKGVEIDNRPIPRKYHRFGANLTGYTHMCDEREQELPLIMAAEQPKAFAECPFKSFHVGHYHKKRERVYTRGDTHGGVEIQVVPSLSGTDAFHFNHGYVGSVKASMGFVVDPERGVRNTITARPSASLYRPCA